ncbi:MAG: MoaD/ThiS family protein [Pirellulaceae bacterium]
MTLRVEFFGIARQRAGVAHAEIALPERQATLGTAFDHLVAAFPGLAQECIVEGCLRSGFSANIGGERFVSDPATVLTENDCLLILSADAGG